MRRWIVILILFSFLLVVPLAHAQQSNVTVNKVEVVVYADNQVPLVFKMPEFSLIGTRPLLKGDKIIDAVHFTAKGRNLYKKVIEHCKEMHEQKAWDPRFMRMLVIQKNVNKAFSTSGSVSVSNSTSDNENLYTGTIQKGTNSTLSNSGSLAPSYSQSWTSQSFDIWFFKIDQ